MKNVQNGASWFFKIHRRLIKPPLPVTICCPSCGRKFLTVNADMAEISNDFGMGMKEIKAKDVWMLIKHSCGSKITLYWKDD